MVKKIILISIVVAALAAGRAYSAQSPWSSGQPSWGHGQPGSTPVPSPGQGGVQKGGEKEKAPRESGEDQAQSEKKRVDERTMLMKNNTLLVMKSITAITKGLTNIMERDMSPGTMAKVAPLMKELSAEVAEMQNIISKEHPAEDELVTLRLKVDVTKKKTDQLK